ncbi:MAG TPA: alkaline phosphatase family protein [Fimbriimonas sp.]|nr:alkaline phosphatase family protein [Fimbriimonas sp.]
MKSALVTSLAVLALVGVAFSAKKLLFADRVGSKNEDGVLVATGQRAYVPPLTAQLGRRPVDLVLSPDQTTAYVKENRGLSIVDLGSMRVAQEAPVSTGASLGGLSLSGDGHTLAYTDAGDGLLIYGVDGAHATLKKTIKLPHPSIGGMPYPCGVVLSKDARTAYVCLNRSNSLAVVDIDSGRVTSTLTVDTAPFGVAVDEEKSTAWVTCWALPAQKGKPEADASGTPVEVDERGIGTGGSLCILDLTGKAKMHRIKMESQPTEILLLGNTAYATCSNGDVVEQVDVSKETTSKALNLQGDLAGSAPNSLALENFQLYAACGGRNSILKLEAGRKPVETPTPWYPVAIRPSRKGLVVACAQGIGSRGAHGTRNGWGVYDFTGTVSVIDDHATWKPVEDDATTRTADRSEPVPVPKEVGQPSVIKHVVYILKENRTYDQVLGDLPEGAGDPSLTIYGREVTPNQHALAEQFGLLDNYYCNGTNSADGHAWAMEGNATTYYERAFGGFTRSYPFGDDPLATSRSGYIWDNVISHGVSFKNFGEFDYATPVPNSSFKQVYNDFKSGARKIGFKQNIGVARLRRYSVKGFPGWNLDIPDVLREDVFAKEFAKMEASNDMPQFTILYLPQDHTSGENPSAPTPRAMVADNDLAVGKAIDVISHSRFWPTTCVFVVEDDSQDGFDHVDGHRSTCLVVSPYTKHGATISEFYNQTSLLRTIEHILGLPPMNRFDARSPLMTDCFQPTADLTPFTALPNKIPLDEENKRSKTAVLIPTKGPDMADDDVLNRILWRAAKGSEPYPSAR